MVGFPIKFLFVGAPLQSSSLEIVDSFKIKGLFNWLVAFKVPLFYDEPQRGQIKVVARITQPFDKTTQKSRLYGPEFKKNDKVITFLQGGPGFPTNTPLSRDGYIGALLDKGYTIVNYDQRGTGLSTPLEFSTFTLLGESLGYGKEITEKNLDQYMELIQCFRADSVVKDCEEIRKTLFVDQPEKKWSIQGQSYGGFCSNTYMSLFPNSLNEVIMTGGIPGIGLGVDDVYRATFKRTVQRNNHYFIKYPQDIKSVKRIVKYLKENEVILPNGGKLSVERFQELGIGFGASGGTDAIHDIVSKLSYEIFTLGFLTYNSLNLIQSRMSFDTNPIYFLFQEAIYLDGPGKASNWSAERIRHETEYSKYFNLQEHSNIDDEKWLSDPNIQVFFTGEMVFPSMLDDYKELRPYKLLAEKIHNFKDWKPLYNKKVLHSIYDSLNSYYQRNMFIEIGSERKISRTDVNIIKVVAAVYYNDQYVDFNLSEFTIKEQYGHIRTLVTSEYFHNGLGAGGKQFMNKLLDLLVAEYD